MRIYLAHANQTLLELCSAPSVLVRRNFSTPHFIGKPRKNFAENERVKSLHNPTTETGLKVASKPIIGDFEPKKTLTQPLSRIFFGTRWPPKGGGQRRTRDRSTRRAMRQKLGESGGVARNASTSCNLRTFQRFSFSFIHSLPPTRERRVVHCYLANIIHYIPSLHATGFHKPSKPHFPGAFA